MYSNKGGKNAYICQKLTWGLEFEVYTSHSVIFLYRIEMNGLWQPWGEGVYKKIEN